MQIWIFSKHPVFKYDFWEKTWYSNMNFWCLLFTPDLQVNFKVILGHVHQKSRNLPQFPYYTRGENAQTKLSPSDLKALNLRKDPLGFSRIASLKLVTLKVTSTAASSSRWTAVLRVQDILGGRAGNSVYLGNQKTLGA